MSAEERSAARNPYDGGNKPCASSEPHEPHTWTLAAIDGNYYDCPGVPEPPAASVDWPSYYFGSGTRRHEASHLTDNWVTMWCGIGGRTSGPAVKVRSSRVEPNCRACARAKARNLANA